MADGIPGRPNRVLSAGYTTARKRIIRAVVTLRVDSENQLGSSYRPSPIGPCVFYTRAFQDGTNRGGTFYSSSGSTRPDATWVYDGKREPLGADFGDIHAEVSFFSGRRRGGAGTGFVPCKSRKVNMNVRCRNARSQLNRERNGNDEGRGGFFGEVEFGSKSPAAGLGSTAGEDATVSPGFSRWTRFTVANFYNGVGCARLRDTRQHIEF